MSDARIDTDEESKLISDLARIAGIRIDVAASIYLAGKRAQSAAPAGEPVAWMYEHDGQVYDDHDPPLITVNRWQTCEEPWTETPLYAAPAVQGPPREPTREMRIAARQAMDLATSDDDLILIAVWIAMWDSWAKAKGAES